MALSAYMIKNGNSFLDNRKCDNIKEEWIKV